MAGLTLRSVYKNYGDVPVIKGVDLDIQHGEFVVFVGPSGCGKSTLLRMIAGLEDITSGEVRIGDRVVNDVEPRDRGVAMVFQSYALYPHMTVYDNVGFGLKLARTPKDVRDAKIREAARILQMEHLLERKPSQLSGGQRQRVALARALAIEPTVLLLDEPFGALDAKVRKELRRWLRQIHQETGLTTIFVTHDQEKALELADRVVIMRAGQIEQIGTPAEIYDEPATPFVCEFLGNVTRFDITLKDGEGEVLGELLPVAEGAAYRDGPAVAYVRSHEIEIAAGDRAAGRSAIVRAIRPFGASVSVDLDVEGHA
ncbi:MAG TPA: ABC transporter ATP-binding protein, partial [Asticcacaulis sp.]|nr:ABC transporter ATP-binding protein [Asticcacaulis sp.]